MIYDTSRFLSGSPLDPKPSQTEASSFVWFPQLREFKGRIVPVKSLMVIYWGDLDEQTQGVKPIPLWKIRGIRRPPLKDDDGDGIPEVNTLDEIKDALRALKSNDAYGNPVSRSPVLIKGGFLYRLDKKGNVEKVEHEQAKPIDFSLSHNVVSGSGVLGARGCKDCHTKSSPFFLRKILTDPFNENGRPVYAEAWERFGIGREKLDRLFSEPEGL